MTWSVITQLSRWQPRVVACAVCSALAACGSEPGGAGASRFPPSPHAPQAAIPAAIHVAPSTVVEGTTITTLQKSQTVPPYTITKTPITVGEYRQCVDANVCRVPASKSVGPSLVDQTTYSDQQNDSVPVTGIDVSDATAYCSWVGGALPRAAEWLLAARGAQVQRHPWGAPPASCTQVPRTTFYASGTTGCCGASCTSAATFAVGQHSAGDSPAGLGDVLLVRAELLRSDASSAFPACWGSSGGCAIVAFAPGSIDVVVPATDAPADRSVTSAAGFRCVWEEGQQ